MANNKNMDVALVVCAVFGFFGLDKLYKGSIVWFLIKLISFVVGTSLVTWVPGIGRILGFIFSIILFIWWLADIIFAINNKYEIDPFKYLQK